MSYELTEQSQHDGKPVELFRYHGTYQDFYYTSGQKPVSFQAPDESEPNTYLPLAMRRSAVNDTTADDDNSELTVDLPVTTDLVAIYGFQIAPPDLELTIFRGHNAGEFVQYWNGNVENISVVKGTATIRIPSKLASALNADFPNVYFQGPCNHNLFDARCKVVFEDWSVTAAITALDNKIVTVDDVGVLDGQLVGGDAILASGERRMVVTQTGNVLGVNYPFAGAEVDGEIILAAGCDLAHLGDCKTKFDNVVNFGGFPYIPPDNIFSSGLEPAKELPDNTCLPAIPPPFDGWYWKLWVDWEPGGSAAPGTWVFVTIRGGDADPPTFPDAVTVLWSFTSPLEDFATMGKSGAAIHVQHQSAYGLSGAFRMYYKHWTDSAWTQFTLDNMDLPADDAVQPDGRILSGGVFPHVFGLTVP